MEEYRVITVIEKDCRGGADRERKERKADTDITVINTALWSKRRKKRIINWFKAKTLNTHKEVKSRKKRPRHRN